MKKVAKHIKVVLIKDIPYFGQAGEIKEAKPGYARNYLIPNQMVYFWGDPRAKEILFERAKQKKSKIGDISHLASQEIIFNVKVNEKNQPYQSIGAKEIAQRLEIEELTCDSKPIKSLGKFPVKISRGNQTIQVIIVIKAER